MPVVKTGIFLICQLDGSDVFLGHLFIYFTHYKFLQNCERRQNTQKNLLDRKNVCVYDVKVCVTLSKVL